MVACGPMPTDRSAPPAIAIRDWPLPYAARLDSRPLAAIDLVVIHCTELPDMAMARELFTRTVIMDEGQIVADGPTAALFADAALLEAHGLEQP